MPHSYCLMTLYDIFTFLLLIWSLTRRSITYLPVNTPLHMRGSENSEVARPIYNQQLGAHISIFRVPWKQTTLWSCPVCQRGPLFQRVHWEFRNPITLAHKHVLYVLPPPTRLSDQIVKGARWQRQCDSMWIIVSEKKVKEGNWGVSGGNKVCRCQRNFVCHHKTMMNLFMGGWRCQVKDKHHIITP